MEIRNKARRQQPGILWIFLIAMVLTLLAKPAPAPAQTVVISDDQNATVELGLSYGLDSDGTGTATINSGVTVNDSFGDEAVKVSEFPQNDLWTINNQGSLISDNADSVYIYTTCTVNNNGMILSELDAGVLVEADPDTDIVLNNSAVGLIQGGTFGVFFNFDDPSVCTGTIVNNGTIIGDVGIQVQYGATTLTNYGTITGLAGEAVVLGLPALDSNNYTLDNFGTIIGVDDGFTPAVSFGDGNDLITLYDGSRVIDGDIVTGGGNNTLTVMTGAQMINGKFDGEGNDLLKLDGDGTGAVIWDVINFEDLAKYGAGRWTLETALVLLGGAGTVDIVNGDLGVNTNVTGLGAAVTIAAGSTLSGNGSLDRGITNSGTIAPGNGSADPFGTLAVTGDVTINAGGSMAVDIGANGSRDLLNLTGSVTGNGTADLYVNEYTAIPDGDLIYIILSGSAIDTFTPTLVQGSDLLVTFSQQLGAGDLSLGILTARIPYSTFAETEDQTRVADALLLSVGDCTEDLGIVLAYIDFLPTEQDLQNAYEQLQPKPYAIHPDLILQSASFYRNMVNSRLAARRREPALAPSFDGSTAPQTIPALTGYSAAMDPYSGSGGTVEITVEMPTENGKWELYSQYFSYLGQENQSSSGYGYESLTFGALLGLDRRFGRKVVSGFFTGAEISDIIWSTAGNNGSKISVALGPYLSFYKNRFVVEGSLTGSANWFNNDRLISINDLVRSAKAEYAGYDIAAQISTLYELRKGGLSLTPVGRLHYDFIYMDAFEEQGADSVNLIVSDRQVHSLGHEIGAAMAYDIEVGSWVVRPEIGAGWFHEYLDTRRDIQSSLTGAPDNSFTIAAPAPPGNTFRWQAGIGFAQGRFLSGTLMYEGELYENIWNHSLQAGLAYHY